MRYIIPIVLIATVATAAEWSSFRGPAGNGIADVKSVPLTWSATEHVRWKTPLPQGGNGSPVVSGECVFLTCAEDADGHERSLYCFDRQDGSVRWKRTVTFDQTMPTHKTNPYCASTPASDGKHVVVWHGTPGLYCYDHAGNELWHRELGEFRHMWGYATSPVIYKDRVFLNAGPGKDVFMACFDLASGEERWRVPEPTDGDGERRGDGKYMGSWTTPVVTKIDGRDQVVCTMPTRVLGYDVDTGDVIWTCDGLRSDKGDLAYSSPMIGDGLCVVIGGFNGAAMAFKLGGTGDITEKNRLWREPTSKQSIGSGVMTGGYLYLPDAGPGTLRCLDPKTGKVQWTERAGTFWASAVLADGRLYAINQDGTTHVFRPNPKEFKSLATNEIGETCNATPAVADGELYIRTFEHLFRIGE